MKTTRQRKSPNTLANDSTEEIKTKKSRQLFFASFVPDIEIPKQFCHLVFEIEKILGMPVWVIIQNVCPHCGDTHSDIGFHLFKSFQRNLAQIPPGKPLAILIESPGGDAHYAYRLARLLQRRTNNQLVVMIPQYAKSAATLLALGARQLIIGRHAELGPLDVQMFDTQREESGSALDAVQALERLNAFALTAVDQTVPLLQHRTGKRTDVLIPHVLTYVSSFLRPLLEKIDTVDYTRKSRELKVAEEYAVRLMRQNYTIYDAKRIARKLVEKYPTHGFVIDREEACSHSEAEEIGLGLQSCKLSGKFARLEEIMIDLVPFLDGMETVLGKIQKVQYDKSNEPKLRRADVRKNGHAGSRGSGN